MRGLAIAWVVALHVLDSLGNPSAREISWQLVAYILVSNATVPFIFVSGFLFQHLSDSYHPAGYLWRRIATVILPYLLVSIPSILHQYWSHTGIYLHQGWRSPWTVALSAYLTGAHLITPLWYIPMIALFYLASPLLIRAIRQPRLYWAILPLVVLAMFLHRSRGHRVVWQSALYFLPVFLVGMATSQYRGNVWQWLAPKRRAVFLAVAGFLVGALWLNGHAGPLFSQVPFSTENGVVDLDLLGRIGLTVLCLDFLRLHDARVHSQLALLAETSFGIFFLHGFILERVFCPSIRDHVTGS